MKKTVFKYPILLILAILFAAPGIAAYIVFHHPSLMSATKTNKGNLLNPPIQLTELEKNKKWKIIFWSPKDCGKTCLKQLDVLARVRLALGRKLYLVDQWLVLKDSTEVEKLTAHAHALDFHIVSATTDFNSLKSRPAIYIANPDNFLILSYAAKVKPEDVYKDLKLLLNTSEIKS